jgi:hypothetical protein
MDIGLLWFDNDPKTAIEEKIRRAAGYYRRKYGQPANIVMTNTATLAAQSSLSPPFEIELDDIALKVLAAGNVLPHHFWVGVASKREPKAS